MHRALRGGDAERAVKYLNGTKLDDREIRIDFDWGYEDGRQFGRGKSGGQVRDEYRTYYDGGRGGYGKLLKTELDALAAEANGEGEGEEEGAGGGGGGGGGYRGESGRDERVEGEAIVQRAERIERVGGGEGGGGEGGGGGPAVGSKRGRDDEDEDAEREQAEHNPRFREGANDSDED